MNKNSRKGRLRKPNLDISMKKHGKLVGLVEEYEDLTFKNFFTR